MHLSLAMIALAAQLAATLRVLTYRRNGARYRYHVSWIAWVLVVCMGGSSIELLLHAESVGFFEACTAVLLSLFVFGTRGNVACFLRSNQR